MTMRFITKNPQWIVTEFQERDAIRWDSYPDRHALPFSGLPASVQGQSEQGRVTFHLTHPVPVERRTQDDADSWRGGFSRNSALLYTGHQPGPIVMYFDRPVRGLRTRIEAWDTAPFQASVRAFTDAQILPLPKNGTRTDGVWNEPALLIGFLEDDPAVTPLVTRVEFQIQILGSTFPVDASFAISGLEIVLA